MTRKQERRKEVRRVRAEGRAAFKAGRHIQTCPYHRLHANAFQWREGWWEGHREAERQQ